MTWRRLATLILVCALVALGGYVTWDWLSTPPVTKEIPKEQAVPLKEAAPATEVVKAHAPLRAIKKTPAVKKTTKLPDEVFDDPGKELLATAKFKAREDTTYTVTGVFDTRSGKTSLAAVEDASPWLSFPNRGAVGLGASVLTGDIRLRGRYDAVRSKDFVLTLEGRLEEGGRKDAEIYIDWRF